MISRREFVAIAAAVAGAGPRPSVAAVQRSAKASAERFRGATEDRARAIDLDGRTAESVEIVHDCDGPFCRARAVNRGSSAVRLKEIVLLDAAITLPPETALYGEGFQMLSQTGGTLAQPADLSQYTDARHYKMAASPGTHAYYGLVTLTPPGRDTSLFAFTSCARFSGRLEIGSAPYRIAAIVDTEGLELGPRETWTLEELMLTSGADRAALMAQVAARLASHHPPLAVTAPPTGWCSWYCFGPRVTAQQVLDNLDVIAKTMPALKYIQIDDGYQSAMGDWLDTGAAFGGDVRAVLDAIRKRGFEPAIWVAPFVAEEGSKLFQQHRDWFVKDESGAPLRSDRVTFGGWRRGPWFALDGTHPDAQAHLTRVFRTMRDQWGCTYFKLDANFWGAMHGGRFHDPRATRIEAYRRGMQAILRGAGDAFILGCNHPIWSSIGLVHGSRSSNDIKRSWDRISTTARQNLSRNWQNGRLWWNDPDAICLAADLTDAECQFHATTIYASGGMVLSGDDLTTLPPARAAMLKKLLPPTGIAAAFEDASLRVGEVRLPDARMLCLFNWDDAVRTTSFTLERPSTIADFWSGESLGRREGRFSIDVPARSARMLRLT